MRVHPVGARQLSSLAHGDGFAIELESDKSFALSFSVRMLRCAYVGKCAYVGMCVCWGVRMLGSVCGAQLSFDQESSVFLLPSKF